MDENLKHLSKSAKRLLLRLRTKYHASPSIESAWLPFPDIAQAMGIDADAVKELTKELQKYSYVFVNPLIKRPEVIWQARISDEGLSAAEQLTLSYQAKKLFAPLRTWIGGLVLGIAITIAGTLVINHYLTTDSKTSDPENANSEQAAPE
ncbi:MAG: hypothetical protein O7D91_18625 [Planctomycetota bacterium]|nr:hypothetical protein [Planctomycetota bacterium]